MGSTLRGLPMIGVMADVKALNGQTIHAVTEKYLFAVARGSGALPVILPGVISGLKDAPPPLGPDIDSLLGGLDGLFLPGSPSNVEPPRYGRRLDRPDTLLDPQRDDVSLRLIKAAVEQGVPLLGVCRGFQEINVAFGGTLHQHVHESGFGDHREDKGLPLAGQYAPAHEVALVPGGILAGLAGSGAVMVNSLHGQGIDRLADGLDVEATASDGLVEAFRVRAASALALAVQWHPEWRFWSNPLSQAIFAAFGDAARERAMNRAGRCGEK
jgi:putative glutamine amidotransferase